jgi:glycosyltransferase involved in cell wall biosynthesis
MKKVLMIAYSFPPAGGPGVQRSLKFAKYFRYFGWEPVALTRDIKNMKLKDASLEKDLPEGMAIFRTKPYELTESNGIAGLVGKCIARKLLIPDAERLWQIFSKSTAVSIIENEKIDLIYSTSVPYSAHLMGSYLKQRFPHIPWVADFRDEWTNNPYLLDNPHNKLRMWIEHKMERNVLKQADYLVTNTPVMMKNFLKNNRDLDLEGRFCVIPNGYDSEDFKYAVKPSKKNERFIITYTGSFYGRRKPDNFFQSLNELISEGKVNPTRIKLQLIGTFKTEYMEEILKKYYLEEIVDVFSYMEHDKCIQYMSESDALLLIEGGGPGGEAFYTGKVFEYMAAGRPILANIPRNGAAAQLIKDTGTGLVSDFDDILNTRENILRLYDAWSNDREILDRNEKIIAKYDRKVLTWELSKIFETACSHKKDALLSLNFDV